MPQAVQPQLEHAKVVLLVVLAVVGLLYVIMLARGILKRRNDTSASGSSGERTAPTSGGLITGFVTNFFDTLGVGSFATTTSIFRFWKMVPDEEIPGTLNVGHTLPTLTEAFIYVTVVQVDARTLILLIVAAVAGAWLGAGVVAGWPRRNIQIGMGLCLLAAATIIVLKQVGFVPSGGTTLALAGKHLYAGMIGNFILGALMTLGIGLYAPSLIMISLLGMSPVAAFPIMMGSCAFLMPVASARFVQRRSFNVKATLGLLIGGIPAVLIAAFIVKSLPLTAVNWLVVIVVIYTSVTMLRAARTEYRVTA